MFEPPPLCLKFPPPVVLRPARLQSRSLLASPSFILTLTPNLFLVGGAARGGGGGAAEAAEVVPTAAAFVVTAGHVERARQVEEMVASTVGGVPRATGAAAAAGSGWADWVVAGQGAATAPGLPAAAGPQVVPAAAASAAAAAAAVMAVRAAAGDAAKVVGAAAAREVEVRVAATAAARVGAARVGAAENEGTVGWRGERCSISRSHRTESRCSGWVGPKCSRSHTKASSCSIGMRRSPGSPSLPRPRNPPALLAAAEPEPM
jgi:hypothetical protein